MCAHSSAAADPAARPLSRRSRVLVVLLQLILGKQGRQVRHVALPAGSQAFRPAAAGRRGGDGGGDAEPAAAAARGHALVESAAGCRPGHRERDGGPDLAQVEYDASRLFNMDRSAGSFLAAAAHSTGVHLSSGRVTSGALVRRQMGLPEPGWAEQDHVLGLATKVPVARWASTSRRSEGRWSRLKASIVLTAGKWAVRMRMMVPADSRSAT